MAVTDVAALDAACEQIVEALVGRTFGSAVVVDGWSHPAPDHDDEQALYVKLVLGDPRGDTWASEDMEQLRTAFRRAVRDAETGVIAYFSVISERGLTEEQTSSDSLDL